MGLWLLAGAQQDIVGREWNLHAPLADTADAARLAALLAVAPTAPQALDGLYADADTEYRDSRFLSRAVRQMPGTVPASRPR